MPFQGGDEVGAASSQGGAALALGWILAAFQAAFLASFGHAMAGSGDSPVLVLPLHSKFVIN